MTKLDDLRRDLKNAQIRADKDPTDLNHMNPGRLKRGIAQRSQANNEAEKLTRAIDIAQSLDRQGVEWTQSGSWIQYLLADGTTHPVPGEHWPNEDHAETIDKQIEVMLSDLSAQEKQEALALLVLSTTGSHDLKWIRDRMEGVSAPKFRKTFLIDAGLLNDNGEHLELGSVAREYELLEEHEGQFGPWFTATALGTAWIYRCYLEGNVPLVKSARYGPQRQFELEAIGAAQSENINELPDDLKRLCGSL